MVQKFRHGGIVFVNKGSLVLVLHRAVVLNQTLQCSRFLGDLLKQFAGLRPRVSDSTGLEWSLRILNSKKFPGDIAAATDSGIIVWEQLVRCNWKQASVSLFHSLSRYVSHLFPRLMSFPKCEAQQRFSDCIPFYSPCPKFNDLHILPLPGCPFPSLQSKCLTLQESSFPKCARQHVCPSTCSLYPAMKLFYGQNILGYTGLTGKKITFHPELLRVFSMQMYMVTFPKADEVCGISQADLILEFFLNPLFHHVLGNLY